MQYYLDIETTGLSPETSEIITIQYANMETKELTILKSWESDEKTILEQFLHRSGILDGLWGFIPVGFVLKFENKFFQNKCDYYGLPAVNLLERPHVDMHPFAVLMNDNAFRGSGLNNVTRKTSDGACIPSWHAEKRYDAIEEYVKNEATVFFEWFDWMKAEMPRLASSWKTHIGNAA